MASAIHWVCAGCGHEVAASALPVRCPRAGEGDVDHALRRRLTPATSELDVLRRPFANDDEPQPFVRFRRLLTGYQRARAAGVGDGDWVALARQLDDAVAAIDGRGFRATAFAPHAALAAELGVGAAWVKDETGNVGGSHKARHLMGLMLALEGQHRWPGGAEVPGAEVPGTPGAEVPGTHAAGTTGAEVPGTPGAGTPGAGAEVPGTPGGAEVPGTHAGTEVPGAEVPGTHAAGTPGGAEVPGTHAAGAEVPGTHAGSGAEVPGTHAAGTHAAGTHAAGTHAAGAAEAPLAIASCGNAALAAAIVARAVGRPLRVFVPPQADPAIVGRLRDLGARLEPCPRQAGEAGDPCLRRFREAVAGGSFPFTCQGSENGLAIEGGQTLAWEMVARLAAAGEAIDRLIIQVGGGALATAVVTGFEEARALGLVERLPRLHAVQTAGGWPLARAWDRLVEHLAAAAGETGLPADRAARAAWVCRSVTETAVAAALEHAARHRSSFMTPWVSPPASIAGGILDDETYDWLPVVAAMLATGGYPLVVDEPTLRRAHRLARQATGIAVDATGAAGLAGAVALRDGGELAAGESVGILFTGAALG